MQCVYVHLLNLKERMSAYERTKYVVCNVTWSEIHLHSLAQTHRLQVGSFRRMYRTGRFIGEDFILAIGDLFNFSPIFKTPTKYIRYDTLVHPDVIRQSKIRQML